MHNIDPLLKDFISKFRRESGLNLKLDSSLGEQIYSAHTHNTFGKAWPHLPA